MSDSINFWVNHTPVPQPRPRFVRRGKWVTAVSNPKGSTIEKFKAAAREAATKAFAGLEPMKGPICLHATFMLKRPKSLKGERCELHTVRPDLDNLIKGLKDSMTGLCWHDDKQVCVFRCTKYYTARHSPPGVMVHVREISL